MRKLMMAGTPTLTYALEGTTFKIAVSIVGMEIPASESTIYTFPPDSTTEPTTTEALGRINEMWMWVEDGTPMSVMKTYLSKKDKANGTPNYTCKYAWSSPSDTTLIFETTTQVPGEPDVISRGHFERVHDA